MVFGNKPKGETVKFGKGFTAMLEDDHVQCVHEVILFLSISGKSHCNIHITIYMNYIK